MRQSIHTFPNSLTRNNPRNYTLNKLNDSEKWTEKEGHLQDLGSKGKHRGKYPGLEFCFKYARFRTQESTTQKCQQLDKNDLTRAYFLRSKDKKYRKLVRYKYCRK